MQFAIFRVGKKFKSLKEVKGYQRHMEREITVLNANPEYTGENITLVGDKDIVKDIEEYTEGIKRRKDAVLAREILLTASPDWLKATTPQVMNEWINKNLCWLEEEFGENLRHLVLHMDETTAHLHGIIVPRFKALKGEGYRLCNKDYFGSAQLLSAYQDRYSEAMKELGLERGLKWSKATHTQIRVYYNLVNRELDTKDIHQVVSKATNSELLEKKIKELNQTLNSYKNYNLKTEVEKAQLCNQYMQVTQDKELLQQCIKHMSDLYKIPQNHITKILKYISSKETEPCKQFEEGKEIERVREQDTKRS